MRFVFASFLIVAACGDDAAKTPDASTIDASTIDASTIDAKAIDAAPDAPDAPPDAFVEQYSGTIAIIEVAVLNPGTSGTFFGQGVNLINEFSALSTTIMPVFDQDPGQPTGCKVWEYTPAQLPSLVGLDEGSVQLTNYPACVFSAGLGYVCPHTATASTGGTIAAGPVSGTLTLTDLDTTFNAGNTTNRYVNIAGATNASNNGTFPIVALAGANTIVYGNPGGLAETLPAAGSHINLAGVGPTPQAPDPGFLADDAAPIAVFMPGGGNHIPAFTTTYPATVGDDFSVDIAEANKLNAIPRDGSAFSLTCGATCGNSLITRVDITTTDASTAGGSPFAMPNPITKQVKITCISIGGTSITLPAAASNYLMTSGATRIETIFSRLTLGIAPDNIRFAGGHAIVGYSN